MNPCLRVYCFPFLYPQGYTYQMRNWDAYWHDYCWGAFVQNRTQDYLTCGTCGEAYKLLVTEMGMTPPINAVEVCQTTVFLPPWVSGRPVAPDVNAGLPPRSANYGCFGKQLRSASMWLGICGGYLMVGGVSLMHASGHTSFFLSLSFFLWWVE